jgi:hypothetical protein
MVGKSLLTLVLTVPLWSADPALTIAGITGKDGVEAPVLGLTLDDLAHMARVKTTVTVGKESRTYEGVLVSEILKRAGQPMGEQLRKGQLVRYAVFSAHDGYRVLFALPEFDPSFTEAKALVADRLDGQPLSEKRGPLQLVLPGEKVGARQIYMLEKIEIQAAPEPVR